MQRTGSPASSERAGPETPLEVGLLGPLTITRDGSDVQVTGPKRRALFVVLALEVGVPVGRERIVEALWPRRRTGREDATLQVHISQLRGQLESSRQGPPDVLVTQGAGYLLSRQSVVLDTERFDRLTAEGRALLEEDPERALRAFNEALGLWRGRPLQDVEYEDFAQDEIRRLESVRTEAVENRAAALIETNRDAAAIEVLEALVRADPARERSVGLLMRALYRSGRQAEALRVFRRHSRHLAEQGLEPSPRIDLLQEQILRHDPALLPGEVVSPDDIGPGRSVRGYELREEAGSGSTGVVYRAFQGAVGREVAVKVVHPDLAQGPEFVRRFSEEARLIARLEHPHVVPLHDFWREPAGAFLVMRWMDGGSLEGPLTESWELDDLGRVFDQLADALGYAHSVGIVHRDIKPANVLFDAQGNAYLGDFRLAIAGIETGAERGPHPAVEAPYASPELVAGEGPTVASDIYGLGALLAQAASGGRFQGVEPPIPERLREVVFVATATNPADRFPDMAAFRSALREAIGPARLPAPRRVRRNPYKGLEAFDEADRADFYGRDDVVDALLDVVAANGLTAVIGASGSGKSSLVKAGLVPQLREAALPGSDEWFIVHMAPRTDPFEEFHLGLREAAVGRLTTTSRETSRELRESFAAALDGPLSRALLVIDQFEELFSSEVDDDTRRRFLDNVVDLALDPAQRIKVVVTLRADFSDRPLSHPRLGDLISKASMLLGPMREDQLENVIRRPAARVGVQVEPGLISEIVRDVASAPGYLPLLQYVLSELFERRREDRLTIRAYRDLGGLDGVLERQAESTYASLSPGARRACHQLFLRMVHLGEHGEETRRRLPLTDLRGLGEPAAVNEALEAFAGARLLTYDRDPVTRTPTVEVAHETVIGHWIRFRMWIDEARTDLLAHRRLTAAAATWAESGEDPSYLLTGGPLAAALEVAAGNRIDLNRLEARFVAESSRADEDARRLEEQRRREEADLRQRARRRLTLGVVAVGVAAVVALVAAFAWVERRRADELAAAQERQSLARSLATASTNSLDSDPDLGLLLAVEAADLSLDAGEEILPEVVDALHQSVIAPKPELVFEEGTTGGSNRHQLLDWSADGSVMAVVDRAGGVAVLDPKTGGEEGRLGPLDPPALGVELHPGGESLLTIHPDGVREWSLRGLEPVRVLEHPGGVTTAAYSRDGATVAAGGLDGIIRVWAGSATAAELMTDQGPITSLGFSPEGERLASAGSDGSVIVIDLGSGEVVSRHAGALEFPVTQIAWAPTDDRVGVIFGTVDLYLIDAGTGVRGDRFASINVFHSAMDVGPGGAVLASAGIDGVARMFAMGGGGAPFLEIPHGGVALSDIAIDPTSLMSTIATLDTEGRVRLWRDPLSRSELRARATGLNYPHLVGAGDRYLFAGYALIGGLTFDEPPVAEVVDAVTGDVLLRRPAHDQIGLLEREPAISADGRVVAFSGTSGDPPGDIEIVTVDGEFGTVVPGSVNWTVALALSEDGRLLAGSGFDGSIAVWETATGDLVAMVASTDLAPEAAISRFDFTPKTPVTNEDTAFRPGGTELAWARLDGRIGTWDPFSGDVRLLHGFPHPARTVAYTADGSRLAVADRTGTGLILDAATGEVMVALEPVAGLNELAFSPDGRLVAGAGPGPFASLWDAETGRLIRRFRGSVGPPSSVAFVDGGRGLRVAGFAGFDRGYLLDPDDLVELARERTVRDLTDAECRRYLGRSCDA